MAGIKDVAREAGVVSTISYALSGKRSISIRRPTKVAWRRWKTDTRTPALARCVAYVPESSH